VSWWQNIQPKQTQKRQEVNVEFIATHWYIWLVVMLVGYGYALANELHQMKKFMMTPMSSSSAEGMLFKGAGLTLFASAIGTGGMVMLGIATIVNIIKFVG